MNWDHSVVPYSIGTYIITYTEWIVGSGSLDFDHFNLVQQGCVGHNFTIKAFTYVDVVYICYINYLPRIPIDLR